jgi:hypothetical protein
VDGDIVQPGDAILPTIAGAPASAAIGEVDDDAHNAVAAPTSTKAAGAGTAVNDEASDSTVELPSTVPSITTPTPKASGASAGAATTTSTTSSSTTASTSATTSSAVKPVAASVPSKPLCKYGTSCYRRNVSHLQQYAHPHLDALVAASVGEPVVTPALAPTPPTPAMLAPVGDSKKRLASGVRDLDISCLTQVVV